MVKKDNNLLPFDKKNQLKRKRKEKSGPTRKEERKEEKHRQYVEEDSVIYAQIKERAYDWVDACYKCEYCGNPMSENDGAMHHEKFRSQGGKTTLENVKYICVPCHYEKGHGIPYKGL